MVKQFAITHFWAKDEELLDNDPSVDEIDPNSLTEQLSEPLLLTYANQVVEHSTIRLSPGRIKEVIEYMAAHLADPITTDQLAEKSCMSRFHFVRSFHTLTGITPHQYMIHLRMEQACTLLKETLLPIGEIAGHVGYKNQSHFSAQFRGLFGYTPTAYRMQMKKNAFLRQNRAIIG